MADKTPEEIAAEKAATEKAAADMASEGGHVYDAATAAKIAKLERDLAATRQEAAANRIQARDTRSEKEQMDDMLKQLRDETSANKTALARERVARRFGLTDEALAFLRGDDEESMTASAEALRKYAEESAKTAKQKAADEARPVTTAKDKVILGTEEDITNIPSPSDLAKLILG